MRRNDNIVDFNDHKHHRSRNRHIQRQYGQLRPSGSRAKKNPFGFILLIVIALSLFFACRYGIHNSGSREASSDTDLARILGSYITGEYIYYDDSANPPQRDDIWVLYNHMSNADKNVYNLFLDLVEHRDGKRHTNGIIVTNQKLNELGSDYFSKIYFAMINDHPEYFYLLDEERILAHSHITSGDYTLVMYYLRAENEADKKKIQIFNAATEAFMKDIDLSRSEEEIELAIHDKLISLVSYDYDLYEQSKKSESENDLGYTAYGALVCDSAGRPNSAVCNGYAMAFEYLCQVAGIPCCTVSGQASHIPADSDQDGGHAWNVVCIKGKWYEVDTTWDDYEYQAPMDPTIFEAMKNDPVPYYNRLHHYYNRTTAEMAYLKATDATLFNIPGYMPYNAVYDTTHIRSTEYTGDDEDMDVFANLLIPIAE